MTSIFGLILLVGSDARQPSCGAVALFALLHANGKEISFQQLVETIPESRDGAGMSILVEIGRRYIPSLTLRRIGRDELLDIGAEGAVVHLRSLDGDDVGHFVFVRSVAGRLEALEPVGDVVCRNAVDRRFVTRFSGWIVGIRPPASTPLLMLASGVVGGSVVVVFLSRLRCR